jgi:hypothetical protein
VLAAYAGIALFLARRIAPAPAADGPIALPGDPDMPAPAPSPTETA